MARGGREPGDGSEAAAGARGEGEGAGVGAGDALGDGQAEAGARVAVAYAGGAALEGFGEGREQVRGQGLAGVLDGEFHGAGAEGGLDPDGAAFRAVVDDGVVHEVRR